MQMFSTPNNSRKDIPCGYPKSFRRIYTGHTVREVFHTQDKYDRFIAVGGGVSYSTSFTNGYWKKADVNGDFSSGCHLSVDGVEINIIIRDNGDFYTSEDGSVWTYGGKVSADRYYTGWSCICAGPGCVVAVNGTLPRTSSDEDNTIVSDGLGAYGTYNPDSGKVEWMDISLPFASNKIRYLNEHFYIYGAISKSTSVVQSTDFTAEVTSATTVPKSQYVTVDAGATGINISDISGVITDVYIKEVDAYGVEFDVLADLYSVNVVGGEIFVTFVNAPESPTAFKVYYDVSAKNYIFDLPLSLEEGMELKNVSAVVTYQSSGMTDSAIVDAAFEPKEDSTGYLVYSVIEDYPGAEISLSYSCLNANIASSPVNMAFSNNGANFELVDEILAKGDDFADESAYGRGICVAVTKGGRAIYSTYTPGRNWNFISELEMLGYSWRGVCFVSGVFVVCGADSEDNTVLYCSVDAESWFQIPLNATTSEDASSIAVTRLQTLMDCRGSLVATAVSPFLADDEQYSFDDELGFFVCDTYIPVKDGVGPDISNDDFQQDILTRIVAAENSARKSIVEAENSIKRAEGCVSDAEEFAAKAEESEKKAYAAVSAVDDTTTLQFLSPVSKIHNLDNSAPAVFPELNMYGESMQAMPEGVEQPTPDTPVDIVSVENPTVRVCGKNLFDVDKVNNINNYNVAYRKEGDTISIAYPVVYDGKFVFNPYNGGGFEIGAGIYTLSCELKVENSANDYKHVSVMARDSINKKELFNTHFELGAMGTWEQHTFVFTVTEPTLVNFRFQPFSPPNPGDYTCRVYTRNIQVEMGDVATEYESYTEQSVTLDGIILRGLPANDKTPERKDEIVVDSKNKTVKLLQWIKCWESDENTISDRQWRIDEINAVYSVLNASVVGHYKISKLCTHFKTGYYESGSNVMNTVGHFDNSAHVAFHVSAEQFPTKESFTEFLQTEKVQLLSSYSEPIEVDITNTEAGQALLALHTNRINTCVVSDANCTFRYTADLTTAYNQLLAKVVALETALANSEE